MDNHEPAVNTNEWDVTFHCVLLWLFLWHWKQDLERRMKLREMPRLKLQYRSQSNDIKELERRFDVPR